MTRPYRLIFLFLAMLPLSALGQNDDLAKVKEQELEEVRERIISRYAAPRGSAPAGTRELWFAPDILHSLITAADLSFADLLLYAPTDADASQFVVLGHVRSSTGGTVHGGDPVGTVVSSDSRRMLARSFTDGVRTEVPITIAGQTSFTDPTVEEGFASPVVIEL